MIKFLYLSYNLMATSKSTFKKFLAKVFRKLTLIFSILVLPVYFFYVRHFKLKHRLNSHTGVTITLTSFPARINKVYQVIISLMLQSYPVGQIVLFLSKKQFSSMDNVPKSLKNLFPYGLKVIIVEGDLRSYKKYIYNKEFSIDESFIIVDDDVIYHLDMVAFLIDNSKRYPGCVCANRCVVMEPNKKYKDWKLATKRGKGPYMATGCAGVYYPTETLDDIAYEKSYALDNSPDGDDIWLKAAAIIAGTPVVYTGCTSLLFPVFNNNSFDLHTENVQGERNDLNLKRVNKFMLDRYGKGLFNEL